MTFFEIVQRTLSAKYTSKGIRKTSCYIHINCTRGHFQICLDWREICDNKLDCVHGEDEENCLNLELDECQINEYRCQNGQCILRTFFHDNSFNPDCLDRTDEPFKLAFYPFLCSLDPSFRCEDLQCRPDGQPLTVCGDGECVNTFHTCSNFRDLLFGRLIFENSTLSNICKDAIECALGLEFKVESISNCKRSSSKQLYFKHIEQYCPEQLILSSYPIFFGHVRLIYRKDQLIVRNGILLPNLICYDRLFCDFQDSNPINDIDGLTCRYSLEMFSINNIKTVYNLFQEIYRIFSACSSSTNLSIRNLTDIQRTSLYQCQNTWKYISKHRLVDGIRDCHEGDDENYPLSCSLSDQSQRFHCSNDSNKCFKLHQYYNNIKDCTNGEDEISPFIINTETKIFFQTICDQFTELKPILIHNLTVTDETNCEQWPCKNIYTECNGIWNCKDGSDENNCQCQGQGQPCVSRLTHQFMCLEESKINDGRIDCIGGSDERQHCRMIEKDDRDKRFFCSTSRDQSDYCFEGEDENYCEHFGHHIMDDGCASRAMSHNLTEIEKFLCQLSEEYKPKIVHFTLSPQTLLKTLSNRSTTRIKRHSPQEEEEELDRKLRVCYRGLPIQVYSHVKCLCPPAYYGNRCQYQNERISLTLKLQASPPDWRSIFAIVITLIDNQEGFIKFTDELIYNQLENCLNKFDVNLLYSTQPKNPLKTYSIRLDVYNKQTLVHRASWLYPIQFRFLPVYRLAIEFQIPLSDTKKSCTWSCSNHGRCLFYENHHELCLCDQGWTGLNCSKEVQCHCSINGRCLSSSLCLCRSGYFGRRCFPQDLHCQTNPCRNHGICFSSFPQDQTSNSTCICQEGYSGEFCEKSDRKISIEFVDMEIPSNILIHFIEIFKHSFPLRTTTFKKIPIDQNNVHLFTSIDFHLIFIEFQSKYYLIFINENSKQLTSTVQSIVTSSQRCQSIFELFNSSFSQENLLVHIKYYHLICQKNRLLTCFYDEKHMCLCMPNRHANCLEFNHQMKYDCSDFLYCENQAQCFQNHPYCPTSMMCVCDDCYYGSNCQFSTKGFALSLDTILGYQILQGISFNQQTLPMKISTAIVSILFLCGYISGSLSTITFHNKQNRAIGCEIYLYSSAICLLVTITFMKYKFWFLILSQMFILNNHSILYLNCLFIDYILRACLSLNDWLNTCVAIERVLSVIRGVKFNKLQSIRIGKRIVWFLLISIFLSYMHDPFHRELIKDDEDNRVWCITRYSSSFQMFDTIIILSHFCIPFLINIFSSILTIIKLAQRRSVTQQQYSYLEHIYRQIREHKDILISPYILILLSLPRLIISLLSDCMKSQRDPWLFFIAYFLSFIPSVAHIVVFFLPSKTYKKLFFKAISRIRRRWNQFA